MTGRYQILAGSKSCHCCFEATVVDTSKPYLGMEDVYESVCECFNDEDAKLICEALNAYNFLIQPLS